MCRLRYPYALSIQTAYTALSNSVHPTDERLARWLLICHDRVLGDELELTHEFLSLMLTVRPPDHRSAAVGFRQQSGKYGSVERPLLSVTRLAIIALGARG